MVGLDKVVELQAPPMEEEEGPEEASAVYNSEVNTRYMVLCVLAIAVPLTQSDL